MWPDLAEILPLWHDFISLEQIFQGFFKKFGNMLILFWQKCFDFGKVFIVEDIHTI